MQRVAFQSDTAVGDYTASASLGIGQVKQQQQVVAVARAAAECARQGMALQSDLTATALQALIKAWGR